MVFSTASFSVDSTLFNGFHQRPLKKFVIFFSVFYIFCLFHFSKYAGKLHENKCSRVAFFSMILMNYFFLCFSFLFFCNMLL